MNTETTPSILVCKEDLRLVRLVDKRAEREGERFDRAIAQFYREWLWKHLLTEGHTPKASEAITLLLEMRKIAVCEKKASPKKKSTWQDTAAALVDVVGDLPPLIPYTGPLEPPKLEPTTPNP
jgi:hypothetical protein